MRGTIHLLTADDALVLRAWTAPVHEREIRISQNVGGARDVDRDAFRSALSRAPGRRTAAAEGDRRRPRPSASPTHPATQLGQLARSAAPLVQVPPRGTWKGSGGVVYQYVDRWLGRPGRADARRRGDRPPLPAGVRPGHRRRRDRLVGDHPARSGGQGHGRPGDVRGRERQGALRRPRRRARRRGRARRRCGCSAPTTTSGSPTPPATGSPTRRRGPHGWRRTAPARTRCSPTAGSSGCGGQEDGRVKVLQTLRTLTKRERSELDEEIARVEALLAR